MRQGYRDGYNLRRGFSEYSFIVGCEGITKLCGFSTMWGLTSLIATPATGNYWFALLHGLEMATCLSLITWFAYVEFECELCADARDRQADNNPYIKMFIFAGWATFVIDTISYSILLCMKTIYDGDDAWKDLRNHMEEGMAAL